MHDNNKIHYLMGWLCIGIPMITHIWLVFLPLLQNYHLIFINSWWRPIDEETDFYIENVYHDKTTNHCLLYLSINDVYALLMATCVFLIIFPLSMYNKFKKRHWTIAHYLHLLGALIYGIELLRSPFTAHCWFISTPFIFMYLVDRIYGIYKYRKSSEKTIIVGRYNFDKDYMLLLLNVPDIYAKDKPYYYKQDKNTASTYREIGDVFYLNTKYLESCLKGKPSHPFTTFYNHGEKMNINQFTKSLKTSLGDQSHKFRVLTYEDKKSVAIDELNRNEQYIFHRAVTKIPNNDIIINEPSMEEPDEEEQKQDDNEIEQDNININRNKQQMEQKIMEIDEDSDESASDNGEEEEEIEWNVGCIIRIHTRPDHRKPGFTHHLSGCNLENEQNQLMTYGPYRSSFANILNALNETVNNNEGSIVLIATGAGVSYIIEFVLWLRNRFESDKDYVLLNEIRIHFSCRSIRLFQWVTDFLSDKKYENLSIYAYLTSYKNIHNYENVSIDLDHAVMVDNINKMIRNKLDLDNNIAENKKSHAKVGRASFADVLYGSPKHSTVFFCGSPFIQNTIKKICKEQGFQFYEGHSF
mmetsp:Transcript_46768/g.41836  ORF Transcript_46768/g.41836 Transcript_46768/m.41836 type:complete len:583 (+) Transcript_46768:1-1749(+)